MKPLRKYISSCFSFDIHFLKEVRILTRTHSYCKNVFVQLEDAILRNSPATVEENIGFINDINAALPISVIQSSWDHSESIFAGHDSSGVGT